MSTFSAPNVIPFWVHNWFKQILLGVFLIGAIRGKAASNSTNSWVEKDLGSRPPFVGTFIAHRMMPKMASAKSRVQAYHVFCRWVLIWCRLGTVTLRVWNWKLSKKDWRVFKPSADGFTGVQCLPVKKGLNVQSKCGVILLCILGGKDISSLMHGRRPRRGIGCLVPWEVSLLPEKLLLIDWAMCNELMRRLIDVSLRQT